MERLHPNGAAITARDSSDASAETLAVVEEVGFGVWLLGASYLSPGDKRLHPRL